MCVTQHSPGRGNPDATSHQFLPGLLISTATALGCPACLYDTSPHGNPKLPWFSLGAIETGCHKPRWPRAVMASACTAPAPAPSETTLGLRPTLSAFQAALSPVLRSRLPSAAPDFPGKDLRPGLRDRPGKAGGGQGPAIPALPHFYP